MIDFLVSQRKINDVQLWEAGRTNIAFASLHGHKDKNDSYYEECVHFWLDGDDIVGLAISEYGVNDMFIELAVGYEDLIDDVLSWLNNEWAKKREILVVYCYDEEIEKIKKLEEDGFLLEGPNEYKRLYDLDELDLTYERPEGYSIDDYHARPNLKSRTELVRSAFDNPNYTQERVINIQKSNDYIKNLDMAAVTDDGVYAAYCIGWRDPGSDDSGYIEPVGTHSDHRRKGLATAVIKECFSRMHAMGIKMVEIASGADPSKMGNYLYDSLNPCRKRAVLEYVKKVK